MQAAGMLEEYHHAYPHTYREDKNHEDTHAPAQQREIPAKQWRKEHERLNIEQPARKDHGNHHGKCKLSFIVELLQERERAVGRRDKPDQNLDQRAMLFLERRLDIIDVRSNRHLYLACDRKCYRKRHKKRKQHSTARDKPFADKRRTTLIVVICRYDEKERRKHHGSDNLGSIHRNSFFGF